MKKTKEQLLADFKKSNKVRREKIAKMNGYSSALDYYMYLTSNRKPVSKVKSTVKKVKVEAPIAKDMMDYVIAFDTTGSMRSYIEAVKKHVEELIPQMFSQDIDLKIKIVAFGDYCDMESKTKFGNAYQETPLTNDQNLLKTFIKNAQNTSGGDEDEFYELVIKKIVEETPWREGSRRAVLFIADCNPHKVDYYSGFFSKPAQIDWKQEAQKAASQNIAFDTMSIHGDKYPWYKELSKITNGVYMPFKSSSKTAQVVAASAYVRGSAKSKATFAASMDAAYSSGDTELIGTYKSLSTLL